MKIVFLVSSLEAGGSERVATTLCNAWAERGNQVTLIATYSKRGGQFYPLHARVRRVFLVDHLSLGIAGRFGYLSRLWVLRRLIKSADAQVVISFLVTVNVSAVLATRGTSIPVVISEKCDLAEVRSLSVIALLARMVYPRASAMVSQTARADQLANRLHLCPPKRAIIANPCPGGIWAYQAQPQSGATRTVVMFGRLEDQKQVHLAIEAFTRAVVNLPEWQLHIYGDGTLRPQLAAQAAQTSVADRIILKGLTTTPWKVMAQADAFLLTSASEGFPNAMMEAMAVGLPCVVFDCEFGPRELSGDGRLALLVPKNKSHELVQALARVMQQPGLARQLGASSREEIRSRYSLSQVLDEWDLLLNELVRKRPLSTPTTEMRGKLQGDE